MYYKYFMNKKMIHEIIFFNFFNIFYNKTGSNYLNKILEPFSVFFVEL
jgi:hypothetical protein